MNRFVSRSFVLSLCLLLPLLVVTGACSRASNAQYSEALPAVATDKQLKEVLPATATDKQFEEALPVKFIAVFDSHVTWAKAEAYCQQHGGRLPRINSSDSFAWANLSQVNRIDGFGAPGAPWPSGLPRGHYWAGTVGADFPNYSWIISDDGGWVNVLFDLQSTTANVACIP
jgi:putative hemolysin